MKSLPISVLCGLSLAMATPTASFAADPSAAPAAATPSVAPAHRDYGTWRSSVFGSGGFLQNIVFAPSKPSVLYTYVDVGGVYRSADGGRTWKMLHGGMPAADGYYSVRGLTVSPEQPDSLLIAVGNQWAPRMGIYASDDAGKTWRKVLDAQVYGNEDDRPAGTIFARAGTKTVFFGASGDGLWKSEDGGATWANIGLKGTNITDVKLGAKGKGWVCARGWKPVNGSGLKGGFFTTEDGGKTWKQVTEKGPVETVEAPDGALVGIFDYNSLMRSTDNGLKWEDYSQGLPANKEEAKKNYTSESRFQALASGPGFLLAGSSNGTVYRRAPTDAAWSAVARESVSETVEGRPWWGRMEPDKWQHYGASMGSIVVMPDKPEHWWFSDWYGLYETTDAGRTWALRVDGIEVTVQHDLTSDPADPGVVHAGMADNGYALSLDGGAVFSTSKPTSNMKMIDISPALPARLYASGDKKEWRASTLWISPDRGITWQPSPMEGLPSRNDHNINSIAVHPARPYEVAVAVSGEIGAGGGGVYRSTDGGKSFKPVNAGLEAAGDFFRKDIWSVGPELAMNTAGVMVVASHKQNKVFRLDNEKWVPVAAGGGGKPQDLIAAGNDFYLARREGGLWKSSDAGSTWKQIVTGWAVAPSADPAKPARIAISTDKNICVSADAGATWTNLPLPPHGLVSALCIAGPRVVAATRGGGIFWAPIDPSGTKPVAAGTAGPGTVPVAAEADASAMVPEIPDGTFENEETVRMKWSRPWIGKGDVQKELAAGSGGAEPNALKLSSVGGPANGSTGLIFRAVSNGFCLKAKIKTEGQADFQAKLALRSLSGSEQVGWADLGKVTGPTGGWRDLSFEAKLAEGASSGELLIILEGDGAVCLAKIEASLLPDPSEGTQPLFGTPKSTTNP